MLNYQRVYDCHAEGFLAKHLTSPWRPSEPFGHGRHGSLQLIGSFQPQHPNDWLLMCVRYLSGKYHMHIYIYIHIISWWRWWWWLFFIIIVFSYYYHYSYYFLLMYTHMLMYPRVVAKYLPFDHALRLPSDTAPIYPTHIFISPSMVIYH